jgi:hypothetical protein
MEGKRHWTQVTQINADVKSKRKEEILTTESPDKRRRGHSTKNKKKILKDRHGFHAKALRAQRKDPSEIKYLFHGAGMENH